MRKAGKLLCLRAICEAAAMFSSTKMGEAGSASTYIFCELCETKNLVTCDHTDRACKTYKKDTQQFFFSTMNIDHNKKIILDTCILIYCCDEHTKNSCLSIIEQFKVNNNLLTCSALSGFELLKNRQENWNEKKYTDFINQLYVIPVDSPALMNASTLFYLYKQIQNKKNTNIFDPKDKLTGDLIIGGTTLSYQNHLLLTSNVKDFPSELWSELLQFDLTTIERKIIKISLLEPNMKNILSKLPNKLQSPENWPTRKNMYNFRG